MYRGKSVKRGFTPIPTGTYEASVESCMEDTSPNNKTYIEFKFRIRTDISQPCAGRTIEKRFYQDDEGNYPDEKIGEYAFALGVDEDEEFNLSDFEGACCVIVVKDFVTEEGKTRTYISYIKPSENIPF